MFFVTCCRSFHQKKTTPQASVLSEPLPYGIVCSKFSIPVNVQSCRHPHNTKHDASAKNLSFKLYVDACLCSAAQKSRVLVALRVFLNNK